MESLGPGPRGIERRKPVDPAPVRNVQSAWTVSKCGGPLMEDIRRMDSVSCREQQQRVPGSTRHTSQVNLLGSGFTRTHTHTQNASSGEGGRVDQEEHRRGDVRLLVVWRAGIQEGGYGARHREFGGFLEVHREYCYCYCCGYCCCCSRRRRGCTVQDTRSNDASVPVPTDACALPKTDPWRRRGPNSRGRPTAAGGPWSRMGRL